MPTDPSSRKYPPFQPDFFTPRVCRLLCDIGETALTQQHRNIGANVRNHYIARQAIFKKYLLPEDIAKAAWICAKDNREHPEWNNTYSGIEYLNILLTERSQGRYLDEIKEIENSLPPPLGTDKGAAGFPMPALIAEMRAQKKRDQFVVIQGGYEGMREENTEDPAH